MNKDYLHPYGEFQTTTTLSVRHPKSHKSELWGLEFRLTPRPCPSPMRVSKWWYRSISWFDCLVLRFKIRSFERSGGRPDFDRVCWRLCVGVARGLGMSVYMIQLRG